MPAAVIIGVGLIRRGACKDKVIYYVFIFLYYALYSEQYTTNVQDAITSAVLGLGRSLFKVRSQFRTNDDYSRYVKENIVAGMTVRCTERYDEIPRGDIGKVLKVKMREKGREVGV